VLRNHELSQQVVQRERRIALVESLNSSLVYFTRHLKEPMLQMREAAEKVAVGDPEAVGQFVALVQKEVTQTLATLDGLEDEISERTRRGDEMREGEVTLDDLEEKYQKHLQNLKANADAIGEVQS